MPSVTYFLIVVLIVSADRLTKLLVTKHIAYLNALEITPYLSIVHARNYGGAFGFLAQHGAAGYIFLILPIIIIGCLVYYLVRYPHTGTVRFALTCILAGALGNMYDRIRYGYVTDFIDVYYRQYHWPAFNIADMSITFGIGLWIAAQIFQQPGHGSQVTGDRTKKGRL